MKETEIADMRLEIRKAHHDFTESRRLFEAFKTAVSQWTPPTEDGIRIEPHADDASRPLRLTFLGRYLEISFEFDGAKSRGNIIAKEICESRDGIGVRTPVATIEYESSGLVVAGSDSLDLNLHHTGDKLIALFKLMQKTIHA